MNKKYQHFIDKKNENWQHYSEISTKRIKKPITVLLGPNGTGKSMSLKNLNYQINKIEGTKIVSYKTSQDDIVQKGAPAFGDWDISKIAMAFASEGERMVSSFFDWTNSDLLKNVLEDKDSPLWVLVDEADSGLSIDRLVLTISQFLFVIISEVKRGRDIHAVLTCNSWEMLETFLTKGAADYVDIIWVPTKESIHPKTYEDFKKPYREYFDAVFREDLENEYKD